MPVKNIVTVQRVTKDKLQRAKELRLNITLTEKNLWQELRENKLGDHFSLRTNMLYLVKENTMKNQLISEYFDQVKKILREVETSETEKILLSANIIASRLCDGKVLHVFGSGHSHILAEEISRRAGGLVCINPILDIDYTLMGGAPTKGRRLERLEGFASAILDSYQLLKDEVIIIISQSGINVASVDAALFAKKLGLHVICLTSLDHSASSNSRHSSGKRLFEVSDIVIDNHVPIGDAVIQINEGLPKVSPLSTVIGSAILQALIAHVAQKMVECGCKDVPIWASANTEGGDEYNRRISHLYPIRYKT